ncbi:MAG: hypothetical protein R3A48_23715 [Polyangiales bacterium]
MHLRGIVCRIAALSALLSAGCVDEDTCFRAITCRRGGCGGAITQVGCRGCPSGDIDDALCDARDGGVDAARDALAEQ